MENAQNKCQLTTLPHKKNKAKWLSPKRRQKRVKNLTSEWNQKYQYYIPHASRSLLWIRFVAVAFQSEEKVCWRRGPRVTYFGPALDPPLGGSGWKTTTLVRDHEHFIPTKFRKHPSSGTVVKADYVFPYIYMHQCTPPPFFA